MKGAALPADPLAPRVRERSRHRRRVAALALLVALLPLAVAAFLPRIVTRTAARLRPGCLYDTVDARIRRESLVALTIDDAPDLVTTPAILDTLAAHGAHATFFAITGQVPGAEPVLARARAERHELGNHFTADRPAIRLD